MYERRFILAFSIQSIVLIAKTLAVFTLYHLYISSNNFYTDFLVYSILMGAFYTLLMHGCLYVDILIKKRISNLLASFITRLILAFGFFLPVYYIADMAAILLRENDRDFIYIFWVCIPLAKLMILTFTDFRFMKK